MKSYRSLTHALEKVRQLGIDRPTTVPDGYTLYSNVNVLFMAYEKPRSWSTYAEEYYLGQNVDERIMERAQKTGHRIDTIYLFAKSTKPQVELPYRMEKFDQDRYQLTASPPEKLIPAEIKARIRRRRL
jgi:hypothetical protein